MDPIKAKAKVFHSSLQHTMDVLVVIDRFQFNPIAGGQTETIEIPIAATKGKIIQVKCQCDSANYDLFVMPFATVATDSIMVIYEKKGINKIVKDVEMSLPWAKYSLMEIQSVKNASGIDESLYVQIVNKGANTGDIYFELAYEVVS